jgi:hypothetical protein
MLHQAAIFSDAFGNHLASLYDQAFGRREPIYAETLVRLPL